MPRSRAITITGAAMIRRPSRPSGQLGADLSKCSKQDAPPYWRNPHPLPIRGTRRTALPEWINRIPAL